MKRVGYLSLSVVLLAVLLLAALPLQPVHAAISSCGATLSPHQVQPGSSTTYQFQLTNTAAETIQWVRISRPSAEFSLTSASATGWSAGLSADNAIFSGGGLDPGDSLTLRVNAQAGNSTNGTFSWLLFTSDDPGGSGQFACDGDLSVTVSTPGGTAPTISNISATNLATNSATINWTTNLPAKSQVTYGKTTSYGSTTTLTSSYLTSHSVSLPGLSASTGYHYKVTSVTEDGGSTTSGDNTFLTATSSNTNTNTGPAPIKSQLIERIPPTAEITTNLSNFYKESPTISGRASDNEAIATVEYSLDGGISWLPVDRIDKTVTGTGRYQTTSNKDVTFVFTPINLEDGNFTIVARATDTSSNQGTSIPHRLVIDRLAPQVGGSMVSIGPQVLTPNESGVMTSVTGVDQKFTISAVGGPTDITVTASVADNPDLTKRFSLAQVKTTGLWAGLLSFDHPGTYTLEATAVDGANNITTRLLGIVHVSPPATVVTGGNHEPMSDVKATIYYFVPSTNSWVIWDGEAYGQANSQQTNEQGRFQFFLPTGKYYIVLSKPGYNTTYSHIFSLDKPSPLTTTINMKKGLGLTVNKKPLYLPIWSTVRIDLTDRSQSVANPTGPASLVGQQLPNFDLPLTSGGKLSGSSLKGKPSVISFITTWSPTSKDQLQTLSKLQQDTGFTIVPLVVQEPIEKVSAYLNLAGYDLVVAVDRDGGTVTNYKLQGIPIHMFIDQKGIVKKVMVGILQEDEIRKEVGN